MLNSCRFIRLGAVLVVSCAVACTRQRVSADARAAAIDARVATMRRDTATVLSLSTEGATLEAAYDGAALRRLRAIYLGETGRATDTFYFDSTVFLVVHGEARYDAPLTGRVADSTVIRHDLTQPGAPKSEADSLSAVARALLTEMVRK
jgi:hypothetical protein